MPHFSDASLGHLATCHPDLQRILHEAIQATDFRVLCGHRSKVDQDRAVAEGRSKAPWPTSKHNLQPSEAVDVAPVPLDWDDRERFIFLAGAITGVARRLKIEIRWGGDWNANGKFSDDAFQDLVHFELVR